MSTQNENAGSKSLMKKTKVELVDIILRKDDVEKQLRKEKADIELDFNKAKEMITNKDKDIHNLNEYVTSKEKAILEKQRDNVKLKSSIDCLTAENSKLISKNKKRFTYAFVEGIIIVGLAILCFCL